MSFRIALPVFRGPLDLLLYLVRKHELEITQVSIADITSQYLEYLTVLERLDVDAVGEFLDLASALIELKSRLVLPQTESTEEEETPWEDPREDLVQRLLEYKKYKDVSSMLEERGRRFQQTYARLSNDLPPRRLEPSEQPIREVELWDLVSALGRVLKQHQKPAEANIIYDDTPIQTHMKTIYEQIVEQGHLRLSEMLQAGMPKSVVIGMFLAVLELVRHHSVEAEQVEGEGDILVRPGANFSRTLEISDDVDQYGVSLPETC